MLCAVYKTRKKQGMYLYVEKKDDFSKVPEALMTQFGSPELVMVLPLDKRNTIAGVDKQTLKEKLLDPGFYLQMPPKEEDLLATHRTELGLSAQPERREL